MTTCHYLITGSTKAACGVKGDPFAPFNDDPAHSFGFVVLGATLCVFLQYAWAFADSKGWTDPITSRIPPLVQVRACLPATPCDPKADRRGPLLLTTHALMAHTD